MRFLVTAILIAISTASQADNQRDELCRDLSRQLVELVGLKFEKITGILPVYWFSGPHTEWVTIDCEDNHPVAILASASPFPDAKFYDVAGKVAQVVSGIGSPAATQAIRECQKKALEDKGSASKISVDGVIIGCEASLEKGTMISATRAD